MKEIFLKESIVVEAAKTGFDSFLEIVVHAINESIGGQLTAESMAELNADQITLLAYKAIQEEVMDGGFIQLIHNGYGGFIFHNPFARAIRGWGLDDLASLINRAKKLYMKHRGRIEREMSDDEFMATYEELSVFDSIDDCFVENEEEWTTKIAYYVDENIDKFVRIIKE